VTQTVTEIGEHDEVELVVVELEEVEELGDVVVEELDEVEVEDDFDLLWLCFDDVDEL
jgi:division protein CdvB (Snf7/Vps24/ESCRT-III family)